MARIAELEFTLGDARYRVSIDFDDAALVDEKVAFDLAAERVGGEAPHLKVDARVEFVPGEDLVVVHVAGEEVFRTDIFDHGKTPAEQALDSVPPTLFGGDPVIGCALKAGVSAVVGQGIDCVRSLEADMGWRSVRAFAGCMKKHFGKISRVAMFRAFKCIVGL